MKKIAVSLIILFALSSQAFGQDIDRVLSQLSKHESVDKISVGSLGMLFIKIAGGNDAIQGLKGIKSFELLAFSDKCQDTEKVKVRNQLKNVKDDGEYATWMKVKDGDDFIRLLVKEEKDVIKEMLMIILSEDEDDTAVIRLKGRFKTSDIADFIEKSNK